MFTVDGMLWDLPCDIERKAEMQASEISGMLLDKHYFNDVVGTFLTYSITLVVPFGKETQYARLYEILTEPVDGHSFVLPYNRGNITITGRVTNISDVYKRMPDDSVHWKGIRFDVISNAPNKTQSLGEAITRGLAPLPDVGGAEIGVYYIYDGSTWSEADILNGDEMEF